MACAARGVGCLAYDSMCVPDEPLPFDFLSPGVGLAVPPFACLGAFFEGAGPPCDFKDLHTSQKDQWETRDEEISVKERKGGRKSGKGRVRMKPMVLVFISIP